MVLSKFASIFNNKKGIQTCPYYMTDSDALLFVL